MVNSNTNPPEIRTGYTFLKLCKLLHTQKEVATSESEYINAIVSKALEDNNASAKLSDEVDSFLDRYFTSLSSRLFMSQEDVDTIIWHLIGRIARSVSNVSIRTKGDSKSKKGHKDEDLVEREALILSTSFAIKAADSLVSSCPHLLSDCNYRQLTVCVVNELLLIDQYRLKGLEKLVPPSPYVDCDCRKSLLLLLRSLTLMTKYIDQNPLQVSLAIFDKFALWDITSDLSIFKMCRESISMLRLMIRSSRGDVDSEEEEMDEPVTEEDKGGLSTIEEEEEDSEDEANEKEDLPVGLEEKATQASRRSESISSCYMTAANSMVELEDLDQTDEESTASASGHASATVLQAMDMEITLGPDASDNKTLRLDRTTFEVEDMSFDQSTLVFDETGLGGDTVDQEKLPEQDGQPPQKKVCLEQEKEPENETNSSKLTRTDTYTLLPEKCPLVTETMPQMSVEPSYESVEDILKTANLDM